MHERYQVGGWARYFKQIHIKSVLSFVFVCFSELILSFTFNNACDWNGWKATIICRHLLTFKYECQTLFFISVSLGYGTRMSFILGLIHFIGLSIFALFFTLFSPNLMDHATLISFNSGKITTNFVSMAGWHSESD